MGGDNTNEKIMVVQHNWLTSRPSTQDPPTPSSRSSGASWPELRRKWLRPDPDKAREGAPNPPRAGRSLVRSELRRILSWRPLVHLVSPASSAHPRVASVLPSSIRPRATGGAMAVATWWWTTTAAVYCNATIASSYLPVVCRALATPTRLAPDAGERHHAKLHRQHISN
uniref:Uncharacterized protein n=2 Tax=Oryza sativa subsp. japonica TaxID=39947 RepID=Q8LIK2_ORYSJ|nr:hypothetical protein [Oryza sativa Japonica Group]